MRRLRKYRGTARIRAESQSDELAVNRSFSMRRVCVRERERKRGKLWLRRGGVKVCELKYLVADESMPSFFVDC
jgi:hypothetical protein